MVCTLCGTENEQSALKCTKCGYKFNNSPVSDILNNNENNEVIEKLEEVIDSVELEEVAEATEIFETSETSETVEIIDVVEIVDKIEEQEENKKAKIKIKAKISAFFTNLKQKNKEFFSTKNIILMAVGVIVIVFLLFGLIATIFAPKEENPKLIYESLGTYFVSDPEKNKTKELVTPANEFDMELIKSSNGNSVFYYPEQLNVINGISTFYIVKSDLEKEPESLYMSYENYFISYDGRYIVICENITNLYGNIVADVYYNDTKKGTTEINMIAEQVILDSIKISDDSYDMIYMSADDVLYRTTLGKSKSKKIDDEVDEIIYNSDDLKELIYVKIEKSVGDFNLYNLYSCKNNSTNKIADSVIKDSVKYTKNGVIFLQAPDTYPSFNILENLTKNYSRKQIKELKEDFDEICTKNFFNLAQVDFDGKNKVDIAQNVYKLNFVSDDGNAIIATTFKEADSIDIKKINKLEDIISPICLDTNFVDTERYKKQIDRTAQLSILSVNENFGYDEKGIIYYLDGNTLKSLKYIDEFVISDIDTNVKSLWFSNSRLVYLKLDDTLMEKSNDDEPKIVCEKVLPESIYYENGNLYYIIEDIAKEKLELYAKVSTSKSKRISDDLKNKDYDVFKNYVYFIDEKDGLSYFNGKNVKKVDKSATQTYIIK